MLTLIASLFILAGFAGLLVGTEGSTTVEKVEAAAGFGFLAVATAGFACLSSAAAGFSFGTGQDVSGWLGLLCAAAAVSIAPWAIDLSSRTKRGDYRLLVLPTREDVISLWAAGSLTMAIMTGLVLCRA